MPGEEPDVSPRATPARAEEPVEMMDYNASITYRLPVTANAERAERSRQRRGPLPRAEVPGVRSHLHRRARATARSTRSSSPSEHEVDLPQRGIVTNYTIITPVQYPGQTETEPFARVHVWLDGTDVVLGYQPLLDVPERRRARRHAGRGGVGLGGRAGRPRVDRRGQRSLGWMPTGEPDDTTPTS